MNMYFEESHNNDEYIDLDELYYRKLEIEKHRTNIYNKILLRIHTKIKITSRQYIKQQYIFYLVPEFIIGLPKYDITECISYIIKKLIDNGFYIKYTHPNLLFISWNHYIPSYEREKIRKIYNIKLDKYGNVIEEEKKLMIENKEQEKEKDKLKVLKNSNFKDILEFKPNSIYETALEKLKNKLE